MVKYFCYIRSTKQGDKGNLAIALLFTMGT